MPRLLAWARAHAAHPRHPLIPIALQCDPQKDFEQVLTGARKMLDDGFRDLFPCDAIFGMPNAPGIPEGQFMTVPGFAMASANTCIIKIAGPPSRLTKPGWTSGRAVAPVLHSAQPGFYGSVFQTGF